ncbi:peptidylprolyl isomerase [Roseateles sp.]|jgi:peptidylprolyl isomerase|uniref:peptidylprolyl isomerase n=1 Tax=Roseateles sp. TaxID=1971397 RepID=UPI0037C7A839
MQTRPSRPRFIGAPIATALLLSGLLGMAGAASAKDAEPAAKPQPPRSAAEILAQSPASDWQALDPENTLQMDLPQGPVVIALAARFAPRHAANIRALVRGGYFDGLAVLRVQDGFVTQWGDPNAGAPERARALPAAASAKLPAEFSAALAGLPFTALKETDGWAPVNGYVDAFPVGADPKTGRAWLAHCYGMVGAGRGNEADSSNGSSLYAVIGHAPRALDLNITTVGRVLKGIENLSSLPRGGANMGFYDKPDQGLGIQRVRMLAEMPEAERPALELLRPDSTTFAALQDARRNRTGWSVYNPGRIELCTGLPPTRAAGSTRRSP